MKTLKTCLLTLALFAVLSAKSATIVVQNANDSGAGSLRQTIADAASGSTITFANTLSGQTITLTSGEITLSNSVTIDASALAGGIQISGNQMSRILQVIPGMEVTLESLTLRDGLAPAGDFASDGGGGAIFNQGILTLRNSTLLSNRVAGSSSLLTAAGALANYQGSALVVNCTFALNRSDNTLGDSYGGGAIYNFLGNMTLTQCTLTNNSSSSSSGGGIYNESGPLTVNDSTFANNSADNYGGGIYNNSGTLTVNNSTFANNSASDGGGICNDSDDIGSTPITSGTTLNQCTLVNNTGSNVGGAVDNEIGWTFITNCTMTANTASAGAGVQTFGDTDTETVVANTLIAGNSGSDLDRDNTSNPKAFLSVGHNLIGKGAVTNFTASGNLTNQTTATIQLAPLGNYGGPTQTMPPLLGSPAIDAGDDAVASQFDDDQRGAGFPRFSGSHVDIGAVEFEVMVVAEPPRLTSFVKLGDGTFRLGFTNFTGASFHVWATTNVALSFNTWSNLGAVVETPSRSGQFQFTDPQATNHPQRFYRVVSP